MSQRVVAVFAGLALSGAAHGALVPQLDGNVVYDTERNITWVADANLAATQDFGASSIRATGRMNWHTAQSWIGAVNAFDQGNGWLGFNDW